MPVNVTTTGIGADVDLADAYKGDGIGELGKWLTGIAQAYRNEDFEEEQIIDRVRPGHGPYLDQLVECAIKDYCGNLSNYDKAAAIADSESLAESMFDDWSEQYLPTLYSSMCQRGIYNSTSAQLLANDAFSEVMKDALKARIDFINGYGNILAQKGGVANNAMTVSINSYQDSDTERRLDIYPKTGQFAQDLAVAVLAYFLIDVFLRRCYFADEKDCDE